jgi:hypothetical protein
VVKPTTGGIKPPPSKTPTGGKPVGGTLVTGGKPLPASVDKQPGDQTLAQPSPDKPSIEKKGFDSSPFDDLAQRMAEQEAPQKPSDVQRHIIRFDYPSFELERAAQGSELARQFLRRITHQRMTIDAFLDGAPSLEKALDKLFLKFGEDEEEDAALLKVAKLYLQERAEKEQREALLEAARQLRSRPTVEQTTPEPESEPTPEQAVQIIRDFTALFNRWLTDEGFDYQAFQDYLDSLREQLATSTSEAVRDHLVAVIAELEAFQLTLNDPDAYEYLLETAFGYRIDIDTTTLDTVQAQIQALATLGEANLHILDYFTEILGGNETDALEAFHTFFGRNPDNAQIIVLLGADADDEAGEPEYGFVPLNTECPEGDDECLEEQRTIYLGSEVNVATIVHEFGHQLDRWFRLSGFLSSQDTDWTQLSDLLRQGLVVDNNVTLVQSIGGAAGMALQEIYQYGIQGFAAKQLNDGELWADLFMTAVLSTAGEVSGETYTIYSVTPEWRDTFIAEAEANSNNPLWFWDCTDSNRNGGQSTCDYINVGFTDAELQTYINTVIQFLMNSDGE